MIEKYLYVNSADGAASAAPSLIVGYPTWSSGQTDSIKVTLGKRPAK